MGSTIGFGVNVQDTSLLAQILVSLSATNTSEWSVLKTLLGYADKMRAREASIGLHGSEMLSVSSMRLEASALAGADGDVFEFLAQLPERSLRYFHGLMEAMDIYQSIHGQNLLAAEVLPSEKSLREIKQIREMCMEEGLRSIY